MNYEIQLNKILKENMTERGFKLWKGIFKIAPNIMNKPSSSTKKYHKKENGQVTSISEHTFEMVYASLKILSMFNIKIKTSRCDMILLMISLHDILKYGNFGNRRHTDPQHDNLAGNLILNNEKTFRKLFNEKEYQILEEGVRFHSGKWSTDCEDIDKFNFKDFNSETLFIHMLDMMSTKNLIKVWKQDLCKEET